LNDDDKKTIDEVVALYFAYFNRVSGGNEKFPDDDRTRHNVAAHLTLSHFLAKGLAVYSSYFNAVESTRPAPRADPECCASDCGCTGYTDDDQGISLCRCGHGKGVHKGGPSYVFSEVFT